MRLSENTMDRVMDSFNAWRFSGRLAKFIHGAEVRLATDEHLNFKIERVEELPRRVGYRFHKHAFCATIRANGIRETGCGESNSRLLAIEKSVAEAVERTAFRALKGTSFGSANSNGWAAHLTAKKAETAALLELIERDASLVHWLSKTPMLEVDQSSFPNELTEWARTELRHSKFPILKILISRLGHLPTATTVLMNTDGFGVASHAAAMTLNVGVERALAEACRLAQMATENSFFESTKKLFSPNQTYSFGPQHHAVVYAYHRKLPQWIFGKKTTWEKSQRQWQKVYRLFNPTMLDYRFELVAHGPLFVGRCQSTQMQNLFFGPTAVARAGGLINLNRMNSKVNDGQFNIEPHFVA